MLIYLIALAAVVALLAVVAITLLLLGVLAYQLWRYLRRHEIAEQARLRRQSHAAEHRRWEHAYRWWNQLQYCYRCHGVFLPGNEWQYSEISVPHTSAPPGNAWSLALRLADYADRYHAASSAELAPSPW